MAERPNALAHLQQLHRPQPGPRPPAPAESPFARRPGTPPGGEPASLHSKAPSHAPPPPPSGSKPPSHAPPPRPSAAPKGMEDRTVTLADSVRADARPGTSTDQTSRQQ